MCFSFLGESANGRRNVTIESFAMKQIAYLENYRRKHLPSFDKHAHSYIELLPPPNHNQHPEGPYLSCRSYKEIKNDLWNLRREGYISASMKDIIMAYLDTVGKSGQLNISDEKLAKKAGVSLSTLEKNIKRLEDGKVIQRLHYMPTPTSYRKQTVFYWDSLMIPHPVKFTGNPTLSSVFSSSSLKDLKDTKYSDSGAFASQKPLASTEPAVPCPPISPDLFIEKSNENSSPDFSEKQISRISKSLEEDAISTQPQYGVLKDTMSQEKRMNIFGNIVSKEELERIEAEKNKQRYDKIEKQRLRQEEDSRAFTKIEARKERLQNLETIYPNWKSICEREGCSLSEIKQRMWQNFNYEPFDEDTSNFNPFCHARYGFMSEEEKDKEFIRAVNEWIYPTPYRHSQRNIQLFKRARIRADYLKCLYTDWVIAIYSGVGERNMRYSHINSKYGEAYYHRWIKAGKPIPRKSGESKESIVQLDKLRKWKQSKPRFKKKDSYEILSAKVDPIIRVFAAEYATRCSEKRSRV